MASRIRMGRLRTMAAVARRPCSCWCGVRLQRTGANRAQVMALLG